ncbi:Uu.00g146660.m01.CDS01 [Anthostomella pinea]|uniref:ATP-dependent RNA helicase n=1 Tax=Anthostomella pinea TaxID=933095 RepID=A0AAI8VKS3_9PEZI|nr:Uu.00g146660.m01.CDS01 [Anthostomella pinea]
MQDSRSAQPKANRVSKGRGRKNGARGGRSGPRPGPAQNSTGADTEMQDYPDDNPTGAREPATSGAAGSNAALTIAVPTDTPKFVDLGKDNVIHPVLLQTLTQDMKFNHMTPVQAATLHPLLTQHADVLAQAKTGTGKTIAFLLPAIQNLINRQQTPAANVSLLVISPTRELAMQIADEATALLQRMPRYKVCIAIGGTNKDSEERRILKGCDILIGTPGRLYDHLGSPSSPVAGKLQYLNTLVLDEADRLLDMGFLDSLKKIIRCLPDKNVRPRQGMLFSATVPDHVQKVAHLALSQNYKFISTIPEGEMNTHERVAQQLVVVPNFSDMAAALLGALRQERARAGADTSKVIVFAPTAGLVDFYTDILQQSPGMPKILSLHARMTQSKRSKITEEFRQARSGVLIATDVIARGMDFPLVTNVFQVGLPSDKESYVHRLGRTARAGAEGRGTFIITSHETFFSKWTLKDVTFHETPADLSAQPDVLRIAQTMDTHAKVYQGWLGFYTGRIKPMGWDNVRLVQEANKFALDGLGAPEVPTLPKSTIGKMGLKGVRGLVVGPDPPKQGRGGRPR